MEHRVTPGNTFLKALLDGAEELNLPLSQPLASHYASYFRELLAWNKKTNLTGLTEAREIAVKHFLDSLMCGRVLDHPESSRLLDVGSGAGFPGLPLKLLHQGLDVTLLEPNQKKIAFLRHIIGTLELDRATAVPQRIEQFSRNTAMQARYTHIVTRAVNVGELLPYFLALLHQGGVIMLCRAKPLERDFPLGALQIRQEIAYILPMGYGDRVLSLLERKPSV